jgi:glycosyltransferase involved in cell wall biosynthesis
MKGIKFLSRYPRDLITGGAEKQADAYISGLNLQGYDAQHYAGGELGDCSAIHFVGLSVDFSYIAKVARAKGLKTITSPNFLYANNKKLAAQILSRFRIASTTIPYKYAEQLKNSDAIIVNSEYEKKHISRVFGVENIQVIYNGAYSKERLSKDLVNSYLDSINLKENGYIFTCSMIDERKNTIRAIEAYLESNIDEKLVLAGAYRGSPEFNKNVSILIAANKNKIVHLGQIFDPMMMSALYQGAKFHYLPSHFETPGLSNLEALASGTPVLIGDCLPVREYFKDNVIFTDPKNKTSIIDSIIKARSLKTPTIDLPTHLRWDSITTQLANLYENLQIEKHDTSRNK